MSQDNNFNAASHDFDWSPFPTRENGGRWTSAIKAELVKAVNDEKVNLEQVQARFPDLSDAELSSWIDLYKRHGTQGLRITRTQTYREPKPE